jgi:hypothetical protein
MDPVEMPMFDIDDQTESLANDLVRMFGRDAVERARAIAVFVIVAFWVAVVAWLVFAYFG